MIYNFDETYELFIFLRAIGLVNYACFTPVIIVVNRNSDCVYDFSCENTCNYCCNYADDDANSYIYSMISIMVLIMLVKMIMITLVIIIIIIIVLVIMLIIALAISLVIMLTLSFFLCKHLYYFTWATARDLDSKHSFSHKYFYHILFFVVNELLPMVHV